METTNHTAACAEANARQKSRGMHHYVIESKDGTQFTVISADEMRLALRWQGIDDAPTVTYSTEFPHGT